MARSKRMKSKSSSADESPKRYKTWHQRYEQVKEFALREGHCAITKSCGTEGLTLGYWVAEQRRRRSKLSAEQQQALEELPGWSWNKSSHDVRWERVYGLLERFVDREGFAELTTDHREEGVALGRWVGHQREFFHDGTLSSSRIEALEQIPGWEWEWRDERWDRTFELLEQFVARTGTAHVPLNHVEQGYSLGNWVGAQRGRYHKGRLSEDRVRRLEALPGWIWRWSDEAWDRAYGLLKQYSDRWSSAQVPRDHQEEGYNLGRWAEQQRTLYKYGALSEDQIERLERLPGWFWSGHDAHWSQICTLFEQYVEREGTVYLPKDYTVANVNLSTWTQEQRSRYHKGELSDYRRSCLEEIPGWVWWLKPGRKLSPGDDELWDERYERLRQYSLRNGTNYLRVEDVVDGFRLGQWLNIQYRFYREGKLSPYRIERLEQLPDWTWDIHQARWDHKRELLKRYMLREETTCVPRDHVEDGFNLGKWVKNQRNYYTAGKLSEYRIKRLEQLPRWYWNLLDAQWDDAYHLMLRYVARTHKTVIPREHNEGGFGLGNWAMLQRRFYRNGELSPERIARLERLPGWSWEKTPYPKHSPKIAQFQQRRAATRWERHFAQMLGFVERNGTSRMPIGHVEDGFGLGGWVGHQRRLYQQGRLSKDQISRLERLPDWSWAPQQEAWEHAYRLLQQYTKRTRNARVPRKHVEDEFELGKWVGGQRLNYHRGNLKQDRIARLEALRGWTWRVR